MFIINGRPNAWKVEKFDNGFIVSHRANPSVSLIVNDSEYHNKLVDIVPDPGKSFINLDIYPVNLTIKYDGKNMKPEAYGIGNRESITSLLAAVSIEVPENYKITGVYNNGTRIYSKDFDPEDHLYFIGNFTATKTNEVRPRINVTAINNVTRQVISYSVRYNQNLNEINTTVRKYNLEDIPKKGEFGFISTIDYIEKAKEKGVEILPIYFPSTPTNAILCVGDGFKTIEHIIKDKNRRWRKIYDYRVINEINSEKIELLVEEGYTAVTLYIEGHVDKSDIHENKWVGRFHEELGPQIKEQFKTVYLIGNDGSLIKVKLDGKYLS